MDKLSEAAKKMGREHAEAQAKCTVELLSNPDGAKIVLDGYERADESIMMLCPNPLSGEWAGDPTPINVMDELAQLQVTDELLANASIEEAMDQASSVLDDYEEAFREQFWSIVISACKKVVEAA